MQRPTRVLAHNKTLAAQLANTFPECTPTPAAKYPPHHQAREAHRQKLQHGRIRDVVAEQAFVERRESLLDIRQFRIDGEGGQCDENSGPGAGHVEGGVEEQESP